MNTTPPPATPADENPWPALEYSVCRACALLKMMADQLCDLIDEFSADESTEGLVAFGIMQLGGIARDDLASSFNNALQSHYRRLSSDEAAAAAKAPAAPADPVARKRP